MADANPDLIKQLVDALHSLPAQTAAGTTATAPAMPSAPDLISSLVNSLKARQSGGLTKFPALQSLNLPVEIVHTLETVVNFVPTIATFIPQLQVVVPFIPLIEGALNLVEELQSAPANDPHAVIDTIFKHLQATAASLQALKPTLQPAPSPVAAAA